MLHFAHGCLYKPFLCCCLYKLYLTILVPFVRDQRLE
uniref:Uncharacterized protein n=1 Tax=Arundo donax TaxID=35708 RepID=A0A0A9AH85_ARUDO